MLRSCAIKKFKWDATGKTSITEKWKKPRDNLENIRLNIFISDARSKKNKFSFNLSSVLTLLKWLIKTIYETNVRPRSLDGKCGCGCWWFEASSPIFSSFSSYYTFRLHHLVNSLVSQYRWLLSRSCCFSSRCFEWSFECQYLKAMLIKWTVSVKNVWWNERSRVQYLKDSNVSIKLLSALDKCSSYIFSFFLLPTLDQCLAIRRIYPLCRMCCCRVHLFIKSSRCSCRFFLFVDHSLKLRTRLLT